MESRTGPRCPAPWKQVQREGPASHRTGPGGPLQVPPDLHSRAGSGPASAFTSCHPPSQTCFLGPGGGTQLMAGPQAPRTSARISLRGPRADLTSESAPRTQAHSPASPSRRAAPSPVCSTFRLGSLFNVLIDHPRFLGRNSPPRAGAWLPVDANTRSKSVDTR